MVEKKNVWKIIELLNWTSSHLKEKAFENPRTTAELLLGYTLGLSRLQLYLNFDNLLSKKELEQFKKVLKRRLNHEPIQYIMGETEFFSLPIRIDSRSFIPRPETEIGVEKIIELCASRWSHESNLSILDICTGSGNIAISMAHSMSNAKIIAIDISENAVALAQENAALNSVFDRIEFRTKSIFDCMEDEFHNLHAVISNPPYIPVSDFPSLMPEINKFEPPEALHDGNDGTQFCRKITEQAQNWLRSNGLLMIEIGLGQKEKVQNIFQKSGFSEVEVYKDLQGIDRFVCGFLS